jgi:phosphoribosylanthranilate isomerase
LQRLGLALGGLGADSVFLRGDGPISCLSEAQFSQRLGVTAIMSPKIKVCGITNLDDAQAAVAAGADALGFVFVEESPRRTTLAEARAIIRQMPPFLSKVGVFVNPPEAVVREAIAVCGIDTVQFHGEESPEFCQRFPLPVIKGFRIQSAESLKSLSAFETSVWLLDSYVSGQRGGTGARFNWDLACAAKKLGRPIILAGGLTVENVAEAVRRVQPYAVDVSSGIEIEPGRKDHHKLRLFIIVARAGANT